MSLRWTACVAPKPPHWDSKTQTGRFPPKMHFSRRYSAIQCLYMKTVTI